MNTYFKNFILIISLLLLICNLTNAQECGTLLLEEQVKYMNDTRIERANTNISLLSNEDETTELQIAAHIIRNSKGINNLDLTRLDEAMQDLNTLYEPVNFRFNVCSINYIDDDEYANGITLAHSSNSEEYQMAIPHLVTDAINVFLIPVTDYCGWASFPSYKDDYGKDWIVMRSDSDCLNNGSTFAHEIGHYFNLYHTHQGLEPSLNVWENELVSRSNCGPNIGDELCDTPADPQGLHIGQGERYTLWRCSNSFTCELSHSNIEDGCNFTDSNGDLYEPATKNVMSYNHKQCRTQFSPQQIDRMQRSFLYDRSYLNTGLCVPDCDNITIVYDWLEEETCQNNASTEITIYKYNDVWNYLDIQNGNERNLFLSNGDLFCSGSSVEACITELGLSEILEECSSDCPIYGCTDQSACNYNPEATFSNGTCNFGNQVCVNPCDESSCLYGCTDESACNYNPEATIDDDSCYYGNLACSDPCDNSTCQGEEPDCTSIFEDYPWLTGEKTCKQITVYYYTDYWKFIDVQYEDSRILYLSDGTEYCFDAQVDVCIESFGLTQVLDECTCTTESCNEYGCTDPQAANYNSNADCDDDSCIYICEDATACNYGAEETCDYGNAVCPNPCDESTCPVENCEDIFETYTWLNELLTCNEDEVWVYNYSSGWQFLEIQTNNGNELYLSDGTYYCSGSQVAVCKESFGLNEPIDECVCDDTTPITCEDPTACNFGETAACIFGNQECPDPCDEDSCIDCDKYTGTIFYEDCGGTTYRFVETDSGQIFDPYFDLVDLQAYEGQRIRFDFIDKTDVEMPCAIAEKAIYFTCLEIIEEEIPEPDCNNNTGTIFYEDCGGTTYRFVETDNGQIYDPYFHLIDLEIYEGQQIKFDFIDNNDVVMPCDIAEKAITITCIEEIINEEDCDDVFSDYQWLSNKVDPNNCNGESITVFSNGTYFFIYISNPTNGDLYLDAGSAIHYGSDNGNYYLPEAYDIEEIAKWACGCNTTNSQTKTDEFKTKNLRTTGLMTAFTMYPNPTKGVVNIELPSDTELSNTPNILTVFDLSGKVKYQSTFKGNQFTLNLIDLAKGMYIIEVQNGQSNNTHNTHKLFIE